MITQFNITDIQYMIYYNNEDNMMITKDDIIQYGHTKRSYYHFAG